jgi:hypothetical protein
MWLMSSGRGQEQLDRASVAINVAPHYGERGQRRTSPYPLVYVQPHQHRAGKSRAMRDQNPRSIVGPKCKIRGLPAIDAHNKNRRDRNGRNRSSKAGRGNGGGEQRR